MKNSEQPAFPILDPNSNFWTEGLTKREYFAGLAMQGWIACQSPGFRGEKQHCAKQAIEYADELLKQLEKTT